MDSIEFYQIKSQENFEIARTRAIDYPELFWSEIASTFNWFKKWDQVLSFDWSIPKTEWFINGKLNITVNCLDRHVDKNPDKLAILWEPNDPNDKSVKYTYAELLSLVCKFANGLKNQGVKKGDRVCIYMPMVPELTIAVLACARIGAVHSVVFGGFSAAALSTRINDARCSIIITADGAFRGDKTVPLKKIVDEALEDSESIKKCIVLQRTFQKIKWKERIDIWWHDFIEGLSDYCEPEVMDSEDPLFILYTSGSTGKPKGMVHTCAGYMVYTAYTFLNVFQYKEGDIYWSVSYTHLTLPTKRIV